jgi:hypothetical protein
MPVFESDAEAHERLGSLLRAIAADSDLGPKAREADAVVQLSLRAPEATVTADLRAGRGVRVETGSPKLSPDVILAMDGDVAHQLWSGELNPLLALAQGRVRTKGSPAPEEPRAEAPAPEAEAVPDAEAAPEAPAAASDEAPAPEESTPAAEPEAPVAPPAGETSAE